MRADLLALGPEALAALANLGLVKRATKELALGQGPEVAEAADGTVTATFPDGVCAELPPGASLKASKCTCKAAGVCRHRVAAVLAYQRRHATAAEAAPWSPGGFDDQALLAHLGARCFAEARRLAARGPVIEVVRGGAELAPTARLATCTVRFLAPESLGFARCDCAAGGSCAHVALAVFAFRAADQRDPGADPLTIQLGEERAIEERGATIALLHAVLHEGVAALGPGIAQAFALARGEAARSGSTWVELLLEALAAELERHRLGSARYHPERVAECLASLGARLRAAGRGELPAAYVLGLGEAKETALDHLRLISLGAWVEAEGRERRVSVPFADPDTGTVLVLERRFDFAEGQPLASGPELAGRRAGPATVAALAQGQVVTRRARRGANRALFLGGTKADTSVLPHRGAWDRLGAPLRITHQAELEALWKGRPPSLLRPPLLAEGLHVFEIARAEVLGYMPGSQRLQAVAEDPSGGAYLLGRTHRAIAPFALGHLARGLGAGVRFVVGWPTRRAGRWSIEVLAVATDRLVIPDLEVGPAPLEVPLLPEREDDGSLERLLEEAWSSVAALAHHGLSRAPPARVAALDELAGRAREQGMDGVSRRLEALSGAVKAARVSAADAAEVWLDLAIRLALARESVGGGAAAAPTS